MKKYYEAYEDRYKQVHEKGLVWSTNNNTKIIEKIIDKYHLKNKSMLEIGCGEGRDARYLLDKGYNLLAIDISKEAIRYCKDNDDDHKDNYQVLDVINNKDNRLYDFIYSIATLHMFVLDEDRDKFYQFIYNHLKDDGLALILSMGDGNSKYQSDIATAFEKVDRIHQETNTLLSVLATSCKIVSFDTLFKELEKNNLMVIESGITTIDQHFDKIMYVLVKRK